MKTAIMAFEPGYRAGGASASREIKRTPRRPSLMLKRPTADAPLFHAWRA